MSWHDEPDRCEAVRGDMAAAADINRSVSGRGDQELFCRPGPEPPFFAPPWLPRHECVPVSRRLLPGYSSAAAVISERRRQAAELVNQQIDGEITNEIRTVRVSYPADALSEAA